MGYNIILNRNARFNVNIWGETSVDNVNYELVKPRDPVPSDKLVLEWFYSVKDEAFPPKTANFFFNWLWLYEVGF